MTVTSERQPWSAIVLAGGTGGGSGASTRPRSRSSGRTLLDHLIGALPDTVPIVVAGPRRPTMRAVTFRVEDPAGSGPVAAIAAALAAISTPYVAVVAVDIPWAAPVVVRLVAELAACRRCRGPHPDRRAAAGVSCCAPPGAPTALAAALDRLGDPSGRSVRDLVDGVAVRERPLSQDEAVMLADIDTPDDLARERQRLAPPYSGGHAPDGLSRRRARRT